MSHSFLTTRWSLVARVARDAAPADARAALEELVRAYWPPLYAFARARGASSEDAADLVQGFFARAVEKGGLAPAERRARFRAFLVTAFQHFCANEHERAAAQKRGGAAHVLSIEDLTTSRARAEHDWHPRDGESPERAYERRYAQRVLELALERLRSEQRAAGKHASFARLEPHLTGDDAAVGYAELARELGTTDGALKVALHRLRRRYGELLRAEVAGTVTDSAEIDDELRALLAALGS